MIPRLAATEIAPMIATGIAEQQRTWRCNNENRQKARHVAARNPTKQCHRDCEYRVPGAQAIGNLT